MPTPTAPQPDLRPVFLTGKVILEGGIVPPQQVAIERECYGQTRREGFTDSRGTFNIMIMSQRAGALGSSSAGFSADQSGPGFRDDPVAIMGGRPDVERELWGCTLKASLPGYITASIPLAGHRVLDDPNVGILVLKPIGGTAHAGPSVSVNSLKAPDNARKELASARKASEKKSKDAEAHVRKAIELYPQYAEAWLMLGDLQMSEGKLDDATASLQQAISADNKFLLPYLRLSILQASEKKWAEAMKTTETAIALDSQHYYLPFYIRAIAGIELHQLDEAGKAADKAAQVDVDHREPRIAMAQAQIAALRGDYTTATTHLQTYLTLAPKADNAEQVKAEIARLQQMTKAANAAPAPAAAPTQ